MSIISKEIISPANKGLENYFSGSIVPQLFVDSDLILRDFTSPAGEFFSISREDIGKSIFNVKKNIGHYALIENIRGVLLIERNMENEIRTRDGRLFHMNIQPCFCPENEQLIGVIVTYLDLTGQAAVMKELEKLNVEHENLMFALSHDIKQPLSTLVLLKDALVEAYKTRDLFQFKKYAGDLSRISKNIQFLINQITEPDLSEVSTLKLDEQIKFKEVFRDVSNMLKEEIRIDNVSIDTDFKVSHINFSKKNLRSIIYNLLCNAIKYKNPDSNLDISLSTNTENHFVILNVRDNGIGISEENQKGIFEKSARFHKTIEGTGMGLYIIKSMMENNGGNIEVESIPGKGTAFKLYFRE